MINWQAILPRVLAFTLLGALVTFMVAWATAWWQPEGAWLHRTPPTWRLSHDREAHWYFHAAGARGAAAVERHAAGGRAPEASAVRAAPWWSAARRPPSAKQLATQQQTRGDWMITEVAYGWPFPALKYEYEWHTHPVGFSGRLRWFRSMHGGILFTTPAPTDASFGWRQAMHALPCRPLALGFAMNTALYGAAILVVHSSVAWARRRARRRRGLCAWCGYDLKGHEGPQVRCPECGNTNHRACDRAGSSCPQLELIGGELELPARGM